MSNCLVTKLPGSVNDQNLPKLGFLRLVLLKNKSKSQVLYGPADTDTVLSVVSGTLSMSDYNSGTAISLPYHLDGSVSWKTFAVGASEDSVVELNNRYTGISRLDALLAITKSFDLSQFSLMTNLTSFNPSGSFTEGTGDIASLAGCVSLTTLALHQINSTKITGDIASLSALTSLTSLNVYLTKVYGELIDLVKGLRSNGKTTGSITCGYFSGSDITFNGTKCNTSSNTTLSWDASSITWNGITVNE